MKGSFKTALIAGIVSAFVAAGAAVATTKTFVLGTTNTVDAASTVTAGSGLNAKMLQLTNNSTGSSATALGLTTPSSRPPMVVSSQARVANLNADKLDGIDSGGFLPKTGKAADAEKLDGIDSAGFVPAAAMRRFGPVVIPRTPNDETAPISLIVTVGQFSFYAICYASQQGFGSQGSLLVGSSAAHAAYAALTDPSLSDPTGDSSPWSNADMAAYPQGLYYVAESRVGAGEPSFTPVTGELLAANGQEVFFNLYMGQNVRGDTGCTFGGSFVVK
jgi:hypothetical protein